jgi:riboflavin kinase/FMN adenylyltransferase
VKTVTDLRELERGTPAIVTIGAFDGVHRGHQFLIRQVVERARALDFDSVVITFDPRPQVVLRQGSFQLTGGDEKERIVRALGASTLVVMPFTRDLSERTAGQFVVAILERINVEEIWVGADFAFGHNREGNVQFLIQAGQKSGFSVHVLARKGMSVSGAKVPAGQARWSADAPISSTGVRELVREGDVALAAELLGHFVRVGGPVVQGHGRGADMGFPTANLSVPSWQLLPALGIYAAYASVDGKKKSAAVSVGTNPTFGDAETVVEAYLLDYNGNLRDRRVDIDFVARIRDEQKFDSVEALVERMHRDVDDTREILASAQEPGELILG